MKRLVQYSLLFISFLNSQLFAQTLVKINNPSVSYGTWEGYESPLFVDNDLLYLKYTDGLYVYDEIELKKVPNQPANFYGYVGLYNNTQYFNFGFQIYAFDGSDFTLVPGQDNITVAIESEKNNFILNNKLHIKMIESGIKFMYSFDGSSFQQISNPPNHGYYPIGYKYVGFFNNKHYLFFQDDNSLYQFYEFNGVDLTPVTIPSGSGFYSQFGLYWGCCFTEYNNLITFSSIPENESYSLSLFDGVNFSFILNPSGYNEYPAGYFGNSIVFNNRLYLQYKNTNYVGKLFEYDGSQLTLSTQPAGEYIGNPVVFQSNLYLGFGIHLYKFDGTNYTKITSPSGFSYEEYGASPIEYKNKLYLCYSTTSNNIRTLFVYDPNALSILENTVDTIFLYPNPATENVTVNIGQSTKHTIQLFNLLGELVFEAVSTTQETTIQLPKNTGIYFVKITGDKINYSTKIVKE